MKVYTDKEILYKLYRNLDPELSIEEYVTMLGTFHRIYVHKTRKVLCTFKTEIAEWEEIPSAIEWV